MILYSPGNNGFYDSEKNSVIPTDAIEISGETRDILQSSERDGGEIIPGPDGFPVVRFPQPPSHDELIKRQIVTLESQQTPRRMREAFLGTDNGWLAGIESQIEILRAQLVNL